MSDPTGEPSSPVPPPPRPAAPAGAPAGVSPAPETWRTTLTNWWRAISSYLASLFSNGAHGAAAEHGVAPTEDFLREVGKASALRDFLIAEGHPYKVSDQIIEEIEAARELAKTDAAPSRDDRIRLVKAYRDLVAIPQNAVTYDRMPPTRFWSAHSPWLWGLLVIGILPAVVALLFVSRQNRYWPILFAVLVVFIFWGLYVFTGVVTNSKLNQIIKFCYIFTGVALTLSILPFVSNLFDEPRLHAPLDVLRGCAEALPATVIDTPPIEVRCNDKNTIYQWVVRIGGVIDDKIADSLQGPQYRVRGGLVVPLYVVVLALAGGAVSMTRRVPEYQRRAMDSQDLLTNGQARENLVFQIMQVVSAPLIATTVFYVVSPASPMLSVVLGFGSGFASEPILLMIRNLVEKLSPTNATEPTRLTVRVDPPSVTLKPGQAQLFTAEVLGSANSEVSWLIDPSDASAGTISATGNYVAPASEKTVTVTARSAADRAKFGSAVVTVKQ